MENEDNNSTSFFSSLSWKGFFKQLISDKINENLDASPYADVIPNEYRESVVDNLFSDDNNITYQEQDMSIDDFMSKSITNYLNSEAKESMDSLDINWIDDKFINLGNEETTRLITESINEVYDIGYSYISELQNSVENQFQDYKDSLVNDSSNTNVPSLSSWLKDNNTVIKVDSDEIVQYLDTIGVEKASLTVDNKTTTYTLDDTNSLTPEYQTDLSTNTVIPLQANQTISHIAANTPYNSIELLDYNNLTLEQAKNLPVGYEVQIPKDITVVDGEYGAIKIYEGYDETGVILTPNEKITYDENSDLLIYGDNDKITFTDKETGNYQEWTKDTNGSLYQSLESNNDLSISYEMIDGQQVTNNIEIHSDNVSLDEIASYTSYERKVA